MTNLRKADDMVHIASFEHVIQKTVSQLHDEAATKHVVLYNELHVCVIINVKNETELIEVCDDWIPTKVAALY